MKVPDFAIGSTVWPGVTKLVEETGEVNQVIGKLMAMGGEEEYWDRTNLRAELEDEIADVLAVISFMLDVNPKKLRRKKIYKRVEQKVKKFHRWHKDPPQLKVKK